MPLSYLVGNFGAEKPLGLLFRPFWPDPRAAILLVSTLSGSGVGVMEILDYYYSVLSGMSPSVFFR